MARLSAIWVYPVKGLRGCVLTTAEIDSLGAKDDRRFMVVDENGRFLSQRTVPQMALVGTKFSGDRLQLSAAGRDPITVDRASDPTAARRRVSVWKHDGLVAEDCGDDAAGWLTEVLGNRCRLVRIGREFHRLVLKPAARPGDVVSFADSVPFLVISEASLANLNDRLVERGEEPVPMNRFRPNLVVSGCAAFAEDEWKRFRIGRIAFRAAGPCGRCVVTTTDQETGIRGLEPLRTLATFRRDAEDPTDVNFGQNVIHEGPGHLRVGDAVDVI